jgi:hypothetical protein
MAAFGRLPLTFIQNQGQVDARVAYYVQGRDKTLYFTPQGITFALTGPTEGAPGPRATGPMAAVRPVGFGTAPSSEGGHRWVLKLEFVGANPDVQPRGQDPTSARISYFKGPRAAWKMGLKSYATLVYADLWPGIDLIYSGTVNRLKYAFRVKPGADPRQIGLAYRGATSVQLTAEGQLAVSTPVGGMTDEKPYAYQEVEGQRVEVPAAYALTGEGAGGRQRYGFRVGSYDRSKPLLLDPAVLVYAGYLGGAAQEEGEDIAVDGAGNAYVTGLTASTEATFPETVGPDLSPNGGSVDAFVAKINAAGTALIYAGYLGGAGFDAASGIAVDRAGNAFIVGSTASTEATFPVKVGPDLSYNGGSNDAFVAKINAAGTALVYAGYLGGAGFELGNGIAVDGAGSVYVTGTTSSNQATFPVKVGPDLSSNGGADVFVAKVNAAGTTLDYAGYIGGAALDQGNDIAVDGAGNASVVGNTASSDATFPVKVGPDLSFNGPDGDAFVAKVNAAGTALLYAGYLGGAGVEIGLGIAVDGRGNAYVTGATTSTEATFPVKVGPDLSFNGGRGDVYVAKVNAAGTALDYAGYIGGDLREWGNDIAVDAAGNAYVTGFTTSTEATFPVREGPDLSHNGSEDAFVAKVNVAGATLVYAGYIGGASDDEGFGIAVDGAGNAYITGFTFSNEATFPKRVGPYLSFNGGTDDAFVAKVSATP